jgi:hypothetical protein|tara:strand:- start:6200 stop:6487 length:288 start_codon:yes stop_codon:yes gene_type:complete
MQAVEFVKAVDGFKVGQVIKVGDLDSAHLLRRHVKFGNAIEVSVKKHPRVKESKPQPEADPPTGEASSTDDEVEVSATEEFVTELGDAGVVSEQE